MREIQIERKISERLKGTVQGVLFSESWLLNSAAKIWLDMIGWFLSAFASPPMSNTSSTTQPHRIPANNLPNAVLTMFVLAWILSCFPAC